MLNRELELECTGSTYKLTLSSQLILFKRCCFPHLIFLSLIVIASRSNAHEHLISKWGHMAANLNLEDYQYLSSWDTDSDRWVPFRRAPFNLEPAQKMHLLLHAKQPLKSKASLNNFDFISLCVPKQPLTMLPLPADRRCGAAASCSVLTCAVLLLLMVPALSPLLAPLQIADAQSAMAAAAAGWACHGGYWSIGEAANTPNAKCKPDRSMKLEPQGMHGTNRPAPGCRAPKPSAGVIELRPSIGPQIFNPAWKRRMLPFLVDRVLVQSCLESKHATFLGWSSTGSPTPIGNIKILPRGYF